jgi:hypothetical protein
MAGRALPAGFPRGVPGGVAAGSDAELGFYIIWGGRADPATVAAADMLPPVSDVSAPVPPSPPTLAPVSVAASARRPAVGSLVTLTVTDDNAAVLAVLMAMAAPGHAVAGAAVPVPRRGGRVLSLVSVGGGCGG